MNAFTETLGASFEVFTRDLASFIEAIDWNEPFFKALAIFHVFVFSWILTTKSSLRTVIMNLFAVCTLLLFLEPLNGQASKSHLTLGLSVNYFDDSGLFIGILVGAPLLVDTFLILFILLSHAVSLLIQAKRLSLGRSRKTYYKKTS